MIKNNKRGSHVGMILSFLVFVTFSAFLYSVIEPATRSNQDKLDLMNYLEVELLKEFTADMSTLIIKVIPSAIQNCIRFPLPNDDLKNMNVVVKDVNEKVYPTFIDSRNTLINFNRGGALKVYYSNEFPRTLEITNCLTLTEGTTYNISLFKTTEEIFAARIINLSDYIQDKNNYEEFKTRLNMVVGDEFGFIFNDANKKFIAGTEEKNVSTDIYVEEIPIQYIDSEANIKSGFLSVKVW
jgi:hypothetical protein